MLFVQRWSKRKWTDLKLLQTRYGFLFQNLLDCFYQTNRVQLAAIFHKMGALGHEKLVRYVLYIRSRRNIDNYMNMALVTDTKNQIFCKIVKILSVTMNWKYRAKPSENVFQKFHHNRQWIMIITFMELNFHLKRPYSFNSILKAWWELNLKKNFLYQILSNFCQYCVFCSISWNMRFFIIKDLDNLQSQFFRGKRKNLYQYDWKH